MLFKKILSLQQLPSEKSIRILQERLVITKDKNLIVMRLNDRVVKTLDKAAQDGLFLNDFGVEASVCGCRDNAGEAVEVIGTARSNQVSGAG